MSAVDVRRPFPVFRTIGNFVSYRTKVSDGSHCGGKEIVADATRRRRRISQSEILFYISKNAARISLAFFHRFVLRCQKPRWV